MPADPVLQALRAGDVARASAGLRAALERPEVTPEDCAALALGFLGVRRPGEALAAASRGMALAPADAALLAAAACAHALTGRYGEALAAGEAALASPPGDPAALDALANALTLCRRPDQALPLLDQALLLRPDDPGLLFNRAATARFLGRTEAAERDYDAVLRLQPGRWDAWRNRSELRRQTAARNHLPELLQVAQARDPPPPGRVQLSYALAKEYEDLERYDEAFAWLDRGARLRRRGMRYDLGRDIASLDALIDAFDADWARGVAPERAPGGGPVFIMGMPRTGSTLLERMLAGHPQVQSLDELQSFGAEVVAGLKTLAAAGGGKAGAIRASLELDARRLGARYLEAKAPLRGPQPFAIDKLPLNYLYAGLIARALPTATIICTWRDPLDTCLGLYRTLFDEAYPFSYDLRELGLYFRAYERLVGHWRRILPSRVQVVSYEALVADPAPVLAGILGSMGLELHPDCLRPEANPSPSLTASASQVRSPVHGRSVGLAHRYRAHLGPLIEALGDQPAGAPPPAGAPWVQ